MNKQNEPSAPTPRDTSLAETPPASTEALSDADLDRVAGGYFDERGEWVPTFGVR